MVWFQKTKLTGLRFIPTNSRLDGIIGGGFPTEIVSQVYGPPASGKTSIGIKLAVNAVKMGYRVAYIDPEGSFHLSRVEQISGNYFDTVIENTTLLEPESLVHQTQIIRGITGKDYKLIVVDPVTYNYRLELDREDPFPANKELGKQMAMLSSHARKTNSVVLVTNQVYSDMHGGYEPLARDVLGYNTKLIIELGIIGKERTARLVKHPTMTPGSMTRFRITSQGIE